MGTFAYAPGGAVNPVIFSADAERFLIDKADTGLLNLYVAFATRELQNIQNLALQNRKRKVVSFEEYPDMPNLLNALEDEGYMMSETMEARLIQALTEDGCFDDTDIEEEFEDIELKDDRSDEDISCGCDISSEEEAERIVRQGAFFKLYPEIQTKMVTPKIAMLLAQRGDFPWLARAVQTKMITPEIAEIVAEQGAFLKLTAEAQAKAITPEIAMFLAQQGNFHRFATAVQAKMITPEIAEIVAKRGDFHRLAREVQTKMITPEIAIFLAKQGDFRELAAEVQTKMITPEIALIVAQQSDLPWLATEVPAKMIASVIAEMLSQK